jgi:hypothetical protein
MVVGGWSDLAVMTPNDDPHCEALLSQISRELGSRDTWPRWPGGWPGDIESALIDAVFSARAVYKTAQEKGVHARVTAWQATRARSSYSLPALIDEIDGAGIEAWAVSFGSSQVSPRRPTSAPGGATKAAAVRQAAQLLSDQDLKEASRIASESLTLARSTLRSVPGIGYATANYFTMLLGWPGMKPDSLVHRFLRRAIGKDSTNADAEVLVTEAAKSLGILPRDLEHAIWAFESEQAKKRSSRP